MLKISGYPSMEHCIDVFEYSAVFDATKMDTYGLSEKDIYFLISNSKS